MAHDQNSIRWHKLVALFVCFFIYLFLGAVIFHHLESDAETQAKYNILKAKRELLENKTGCIEEEELEEFITQLRKSIHGGIDPSGNVTTPSNWDYASAFFFSGTVVTTIGYGKTVPTTNEGRNICLLYALFGIPFTGWLLSTVGNFYCDSFHMMGRTIENIIHKKFKHQRIRKIILYITTFAISYCLIVLIPSSWFFIMEKNWSFDQAHYYSFITLSTIGFGDFVASVDSHHPRNQNLVWIYDVAVACWYVFGLSYLACVITAIGKNQKHTLTKMRTTLKKHVVKDDKEPPPGFGLVEIQETTLNDIGKIQCVCSCQHHQVNSVKSVKDEGTQTTVEPH